MHKHILVFCERTHAGFPGVVFEMLGEARALANSSDGTLTALICDSGHDEAIQQLGIADRILIAPMADENAFSPAAVASAMLDAVRESDAGLVLLPATTMGIDAAALLSVGMDAPLLTNCIRFSFDGDGIVAECRQYGGKILVESRIDAPTALLTVLPGAFSEQEGRREGSPVVTRLAVPVQHDGKTLFQRFILPDASDVDITQVPVLVSVGRGIQNKGNLEIAEELASALNGAVSASRPVIDQGWLPTTRQIGRSGVIVKPRVYIALGISGAPEHVEGMKEAELIIAVNTDKTAPIFSVAHYGIAADLLDVVPALTEALQHSTHTA